MEKICQGLTLRKNQALFCLYASKSPQAELGIFRKGETQPEQVLSMQKDGNLWKIEVPARENLYYAYRVSSEGPWLADPFAKALDTSPAWGHKSLNPVLAPIAEIPSFDWGGTQHPNLPKEDLVIYEMHVRGFTRHASSKAKHPGTFEGIIEKIPYLKSLGVNCIELMPIYEFDELPSNHPMNYWGYDPLAYFIPKRSYAADSSPFGALLSFKKMVKELHRNGIEVILDVVYNHTGEKQDKLFSLRGIDPETYYMIHDDGSNYNYSGCGNTVNGNHPQTQLLILESLRYWVKEMGVDGFRFDLASILTRSGRGDVLAHPPVLLAMKQDPILSGKKMIAEAWDAAGLYQVGLFPTFGNWSEWNGRYRDVVRSFMKGTDDRSGRFCTVLCGSDFLYGYSQTPLSSVNFITAHDGFSLYDLVSYNDKHNEANGEQNRDGTNDNRSWNCGAEGPTDQPEINALRERQIRNFFVSLFVAQGIPMMLMSDEYGHTRKGNNNPYVQDNELNWFLWDEMGSRPEWIAFVEQIIRIRKEHPELRKTKYLSGKEILWHGHKPMRADWSAASRFVAFEVGSLYIAFNAFYHAFEFELPPGEWKCLIDTSQGWKQESRTLPKLLALPSYSSLIAEKISAR